VIALVTQFVPLRTRDGLPFDNEFEEVLFAFDEVACAVHVLFDAGGAVEVWAVGRGGGGGGADEESCEDDCETRRDHVESVSVR